MSAPSRLSSIVNFRALRAATIFVILTTLVGGIGLASTEPARLSSSADTHGSAHEEAHEPASALAFGEDRAHGGLAVAHNDAEIDADSTTAVRGTVTGISMVETREGRVFSIATVTIDEILYGPERTTVRVLTEGGRADDGTGQSSSNQAHLSGGRRYQLQLVELPTSVTDEVGIDGLEDVYGVIGHDGAIPLAGDTDGIDSESSDASGDFAAAAYKWPQNTSLNIPVLINEASAPVAGATDALLAGLDAWVDQSGPINLSWSFNGSTSTSERVFDGQNVIFWGATPNPADTYLARTTVWFTSSGDAVEMDMQFNTDYLWATGPAAGRYDIQSVATHEAGHGIGLNHVSAISEVMYPAQSSNSTKRQLGLGDINGVESLYGSGCNGLTPTITSTGSGNIVGTAGNDVILGGNGNDVINGLGGDDIICGAGGNDEIFGGDGNDTITGGDGNDKIFGGDGNDTIDGDAGRDSIRSEGGDDFVHGGDGNDNIKSGDGADTIFGDAGDDTIRGNAGDDTIYGNAGRDHLSGDDGTDFLDGGDGVDRVGGGAGNDEVHGGDGNDNVQGRPGNDLVYGDAGDDNLAGNNGNDTLLGGIGDDFGNGGGKSDTVFGGEGNDHVSGGTGNDTVFGNNGDDIVRGASGNDAVHGEAGNDTVDGGKGNDQLFGGTGNDTLTGGEGTDTLNDTQGTNTLDGGTDADTCTAGGANCELFA